jgi:predicted RNase H-like HicB family nuclease
VASREYPIVIEPLSDEDGGGFLATVPDLPGCLSDGETREEAARNIADAIIAWIEEAKKLGRDIPAPSLHLAMAGE